jgi:hypothetical protein
MAKTILLNASVTYNSVNLTANVRSVTLDMSAEDVDLTAMGNVSRTHGPGLRNDRVTIEYFQDFASGSVDATHAPLVGVAAGAVLVVKPTTAAVSATNPSYTMTAIPLTYTPLDGTIGDASMITVEYVPAENSSLVRATS